MALSIKRSISADALSLTPLIDVVFLLLVFFLVASQFAREDLELPVKLPSASSALPMTADPEILTVNVTAEGRYYARGEYYNLSSLESLIDQSVRNNPVNQTVLIRGDREVPYQSIVSIMDICHRVKVPSYKLTTSLDNAP